MARLVTINEGFTSIALPDGNLYDEGETATITDAQFARISPVMFDEILTDDGYQSDIGAATASHSHAASAITSGTIDIARIPTGTTSTTVPFGNDARFSDARTPTTHAASHASGGTDAVTLAQSQVTNLTTDLAAKVPTSRTVNGHALSADVTVTASDAGAVPVLPVPAASAVATTGVGRTLYPIGYSTAGTIALAKNRLYALIVRDGLSGTIAKVTYEITATSMTAGQTFTLQCCSLTASGLVGAELWSESLAGDSAAVVTATLSTTRSLPGSYALVLSIPNAAAGGATFRSARPVQTWVAFANASRSVIARDGVGTSSDYSAWTIGSTDAASRWGVSNSTTGEYPVMAGVGS